MLAAISVTMTNRLRPLSFKLEVLAILECDLHHCASILVVLKTNRDSQSGVLIVYIDSSCLKARVAPSSRC